MIDVKNYRIVKTGKNSLSTRNEEDEHEGKFAKCRNAQAEFRNYGTDYWFAKLAETGGRGWAEYAKNF